MLLKIGTYNIRLSAADDGVNSWKYRAEKLCTYVQSLNLDVLGVQEAMHDQVLALDKALPNYVRIGVGREDGLTQGEYCALFVRNQLQVWKSGTFWFSDAPTVPNSRSWGNQITRITTWVELETELGAILITNSHLDHQSDESRRKSVLALLEFAKPHNPNAIMMGDFNMAPSDPNLRPLFAVAKDALHAASESKSTFHGWQFGEDGSQIDYIFCGPHFEFFTAESPRVPYSDHYPVIANVNFLG